MELLLWRWSTTAQIVSALTIAVFFVVLNRSVRRVELTPWVNAWLANLAALLVTVIFWFWQPPEIAFAVIRLFYFFFKTMFVAFLAFGAEQFARRRTGGAMSRVVVIGIFIYAAIGAFTLNSIDRIGVVQSTIITVFLGGSAIILLKNRFHGAEWLAAGFAVRATLAAFETMSYASRLIPNTRIPQKPVDFFLAAHSSFAAAAEWVIALGCVLTLYRTIQQELMDSNHALVAAKEVLQDLVDRDSLTGLGNRRALPAVLRSAYLTGATILFFDLNDFKIINDSYGHAAGDDCLKRFARALQATFRPDDHILRYAGDEFVVVAPGLEPALIVDRVESLRDRLKFDKTPGPPIKFSVGHSYLAPRGDPDAALKTADEAMYEEKSKKPKRKFTLTGVPVPK